MSTSKIAVPFREGSTIQQMYNELKDGKVHKYSTFRNKYVKKGVKKPRYMIFRLCRLLRSYKTGFQINSSKRTDTIQLVHQSKAAAARAAIQKMVDAKGVHPEPFIPVKGATTKKKTVAKKTVKKVVAKKKPAAKPVAVKSKKAVVKSKPVVKPVVVPAGVDDDDIIEE